MSGDAHVSRALGTPWRASFLLQHHADFYRRHFRQGLLPGRKWLAIIFCVFILPRNRRSKFFRLYALVAGAISHRMPSQRLRVLHLIRALCRSRHHVSSRSGSTRLWLNRDSGGADRDCVCHRASTYSTGSRDAGTSPAVVTEIALKNLFLIAN